MNPSIAQKATPKALKKARLDQGVMSQDVAKALQVSRSCIVRLESYSPTQISVPRLINYCKAIDVDPHDMLDKIIDEMKNEESYAK